MKFIDYMQKTNFRAIILISLIAILIPSILFGIYYYYGGRNFMCSFIITTIINCVGCNTYYFILLKLQK